MPPPRRSYATPEETFGITRKPLNDWLDFAASGLPRQGPAFSTELEDANIRNQQRELQSMQLQRDLASEEAASNFLSQAAGKNPQGLMRMLADSPEILGSKDAPMIQDYVSQRQAMQQERQARQPLSNKTLGPAIAKSITDPMERMRFQQLVESGMEAGEAYQGIQQERKTLAAEQELSKFEEEVASSGVPMDAILATRSLPANERRLALAAEQGRVKSAGKGGADGELSISQILELQSKNTNDFGEPVNPKVAAYLDAQLERAMAPRNAAANPLTGAVVPQGDFKLAAEQAKLDAARAEDDVVNTQPAIQGLPPALPATPEEERQLAAQQQRAVAESQKQQLADVAWTGVKGTAAARGAEATEPADIVAEARKAVVGGQTTSKRAQRIAALARAYADDRDVSIGTRQVAGLGGAAGAGLETQDIRVTPAEALVRELGFKPDAIVGQAPTRAGGQLRDITALEAAEAILADAADPFIKLREGRATQEKATQVSDKVSKGLDVLEGKGNTLK